MKQARDLFLLSAIAYRQGKYDDAATLFATAMSSDDADQFLEVLNEEQTVTANTLLSTGKEIESSLDQAITLFSSSLSTAIEAEDEELLILSASETNEEDLEDFDDDETSSDVSSFPGQNIIPSSLSNEEKPKSRKILISSNINSPVKLRA